jgi:uncharacterized protein YoxC
MNKLGQNANPGNPDKQALSNEKDKLVQSKKEWNKQVKEFIPELIKFKQLINGRVAGKKKMRLYESFSEEHISQLNNLNKKFDERMDFAGKIIHHQNEYSQKYNKNKKSNYQDYNLVSEGVHPINLWYQSAKSFFGDNEESKRVSLLRQFFDIDQKCSEGQNLILSARNTSDLEKARLNIFNNINVLKSIKYSLSIQKERLNKLNLGEQGEQVEQPGQNQTHENKPHQNLFSQKQQTIAKILEDRDFIYFYEVNPGSADKSLPNDFLQKRNLLLKFLFNIPKNPSDKFVDRLSNTYDQLIEAAFPDKKFKSFKEYADFNKKSKESLARKNKYDNLIKYAEDRPYDSIGGKIKKFLSKIGLKFKVFFKIKGNLESSYSDLEQVRQSNNEIISDLNTKNYDVNFLINKIDENIKTLSEVRDELESCRDIINEEGVKAEQLQAISNSVEKSFFKKMLSGFKKEKK